MTALRRTLIGLGAVVLAGIAWPAAPSSGQAREYRVRLAYFVPRDRRPTARYQEKISTVATMVTDLYREHLQAKGYRTEGPRFDTREIRLIRGTQPASEYNDAPAYNANQQWRRLQPEIRTHLGDPRRQAIVVFAETYDEGPAAHLWPGVIARGAYHTAEGGLAIFSAHVLRDEFCGVTPEQQRSIFFDRAPVRGRRAWGQPMNSARGEFAEDGIGAVAHELGHALGLPHDRRRDELDVMGNGFRNLRWNFDPAAGKRVGFSEENARLLMASRYLAADLRLTDGMPPQVEVTQTAADAEGWTLCVTATDETALRALVVVDRARGSVVAGRRLEGTRETLTLRIPSSGAAGAEARVQVIVADAGGNQTRKALGPAVVERE